MLGKGLVCCGLVALFGCAQTADRKDAYQFGETVRYTVRMQTEDRREHAEFGMDGEKALAALEHYREGDMGDLVRVKAHWRTKPNETKTDNLNPETDQ